MRTLSGGNQQKLVLARELGVDGEADRAPRRRKPNPRARRSRDGRGTRTTAQRRAIDGAAIVLYSSDIDEVLLLATRVFVVFERRVREMPLDRERIGQAMVGAA